MKSKIVQGENNFIVHLLIFFEENCVEIPKHVVQWAIQSQLLNLTNLLLNLLTISLYSSSGQFKLEIATLYNQ